jgi:hypothetical protein
MRCFRPRSSRFHSAAETMRGTMSKGKIFSVPACSPYTLKVMPICIRTRSAAACQQLVIETPYFVAGKVHEYKLRLSSASATNYRGRKASSRVDASGGDNACQW